MTTENKTLVKGKKISKLYPNGVTITEVHLLKSDNGTKSAALFLEDENAYIGGCKELTDVIYELCFTVGQGKVETVNKWLKERNGFRLVFNEKVTRSFKIEKGE